MSPSDEFCNFYDAAGSVLDSQHYIHPCEKEIHVDEDGNPLEIACDMCEEKLPDGADFRNHTRVVHRKKVYILQKLRQTVYCDECGKSFKVNLILPFPACF